MLKVKILLNLLLSMTLLFSASDSHAQKNENPQEDLLVRSRNLLKTNKTVLLANNNNSYLVGKLKDFETTIVAKKQYKSSRSWRNFGIGSFIIGSFALGGAGVLGYKTGFWNREVSLHPKENPQVRLTRIRFQPPAFLGAGGAIAITTGLICWITGQYYMEKARDAALKSSFMIIYDNKNNTKVVKYGVRF